jgi:hypothetical protein
MQDSSKLPEIIVLLNHILAFLFVFYKFLSDLFDFIREIGEFKSSVMFLFMIFYVSI